MGTLNPEQLPRALERQLAPVYLVSGDETLLAQEACASIRDAARAADFGDREVYSPGVDFEWPQLFGSTNSLSLFAERRILELRMDKSKIDETGTQALVEYCENPPEDILLLLTTPKLPKSAPRSKWLQALQRCGEHVQVWPVSARQLPGWLRKRLQAAGLHCDAETLELLAARTEGNLLAAAQEIEKLRLLCDGDTITPELITGSVADNARHDVFSLVDRCLLGDARSAARTLQGLRSEGTEAAVVLWALSRELRTLIQIADALRTGGGFQQVTAKLKIWEKRKPILQAALRRLPAGQLYAMLRRANHIDRIIKGMRTGNRWDELLELVLNLSGTFSLNEMKFC